MIIIILIITRDTRNKEARHNSYTCLHLVCDSSRNIAFVLVPQVYIPCKVNVKVNAESNHSLVT